MTAALLSMYFGGLRETGALDGQSFLGFPMEPWRLMFLVGIIPGFLIVVIGVGFARLKLANSGLHEVQHNSAALSNLKTSSEKLLKSRLALGSYETLFSVLGTAGQSGLKYFKFLVISSS